MKQKILLTVMTMIAMVVLLLPQTASAEFCKPGTKYTYMGVSVQLRDPRHNVMDRTNGANTYGFVEYENRNDYAVEVRWKVYGRMKSNPKKAYLVDNNSFTLANKNDKKWSQRKEVYSYSDGKAPTKDGFDEFIVAIEVIPQGTSGDTYQEKSNDNKGFSKPGTKFTYSGIAVQLFDPRHHPEHANRLITPSNLGYIEYSKTGESVLKVEWKVYGRLNSEPNKLYKVDSGTFTFAPNVVFDGSKSNFWRHDYQYGNKDFDAYYVSIKVEDASAPISDMEREYKRLMAKYNNGTPLTQSDYASGIKLLSSIWDKMEPVIKRLMKLPPDKMEAEAEKMEKQFELESEIWQTLGRKFDEDMNAGKMNATNKNALEKLARRVQKLVSYG